MVTVGQGLRARITSTLGSAATAAARPASWVGTRLLLAFALPLRYPSRHQMLGDVARYRDWADRIAHGHYPTDDPTWQYPPGAALVMLIPRWLTRTGPSYHAAFVALMLLADLVTYRAVRRHGETSAAVWVLGGFLLGPLILNRFDVVPTAFAVCALAAALRGDELRAGVHIALGALVKVWPALAFLAVPLRRRGRALVGVVATAAAAMVVLAVSGAIGASTDFAHQQGSRGIEIEAIAGLPWLISRWLRGKHDVGGTKFGAFEVHGGPVHVVAVTCTVLSLATLAVAAYVAFGRRVRVDPAALVLTVVLAEMLVARVLSPQYLVWPLGIVALASARGGAAARCAWLVVATCAVTHLEYPLAFSPVEHARTLGVLILLARDALLLASTWWAVKALRPAPVTT